LRLCVSRHHYLTVLDDNRLTSPIPPRKTTMTSLHINVVMTTDCRRPISCVRQCVHASSAVSDSSQQRRRAQISLHAW